MPPLPSPIMDALLRHQLFSPTHRTINTNSEQNCNVDLVALGAQSVKRAMPWKTLHFRWLQMEAIPGVNQVLIINEALLWLFIWQACGKALPQSKVCKVPNCPQMHPTVLHTAGTQESLQWTLVSELRTVLILKPLMPWLAQTGMLIHLMGKLVAGQGWPSYL